MKLDVPKVSRAEAEVNSCRFRMHLRRVYTGASSSSRLAIQPGEQINHLVLFDVLFAFLKGQRVDF